MKDQDYLGWEIISTYLFITNRKDGTDYAILLNSNIAEIFKFTMSL